MRRGYSSSRPVSDLRQPMAPHPLDPDRYVRHAAHHDQRPGVELRHPWRLLAVCVVWAALTFGVVVWFLLR